MQLSLHDLRSLPLRAALVEGEQDVVAHTPEWGGTGGACLAYPVRRRRLLVATRAADAVCNALLDELIARLVPARDCDAAVAQRLLLVAASVRVLSGRSPGPPGCVGDVLAMAREGIAARSAVAVEVRNGAHVSRAVHAPAVVALILVQLAVNAARHEHAQRVTLAFDGATAEVSWDAHPGPPAHVATSRRRGDRERWGLGFARIAADAIGAAVHSPAAAVGGRICAAVDVGAARLALPLAIAEHGAVIQATRAWDEETGVLPGSSIGSSQRCAALTRRSQQRPRAVVQHEGWTARTIDARTWLAVPPDDATDRCHDVLDGLVHERALLEGMDSLQAVHVTALALTLGMCLGRPLPRVPGVAWARRMRELLPLFGIAAEVPELAGVGATDPAICVALAARTSGAFREDADALWLDVPEPSRDDALVRALSPAAPHSVRLA